MFVEFFDIQSHFSIKISLIVTPIVYMNLWSAFPYFFPVTDTVNTGLNNKLKPKAAPLSDGTVVVLGEKKKGVTNLKQFHLKYKTEMFTDVISFWAYAIIEIELGGKPALAISRGLDIFFLFG